jgi:hypothetical protein
LILDNVVNTKNLPMFCKPTFTGFGQLRGPGSGRWPAPATKNRLPREPKVIEADG